MGVVAVAPDRVRQNPSNSWRALAALGAASVLLSVSAFYNGAPLLSADSIDYLLHGGEAARALFLGDGTDWPSTRSFFYGLAILPLHGYLTAWPVVAFQALVTAWVLRLTLRTTLPHATEFGFLALVCVLALFTSASWTVVYIMPDILAPLLILAVHLLCFGWDRLDRGQRLGVAGLVWFAIVSHGSHLLLALGLAGPVLLLYRWRRWPLRASWLGLGRLAALVVAAAASTILMHAALLGEPTLGGRRPLFLMARAIADGPARAHLERYCGQLDLAVCAHAARLPDDFDGFLWDEGSIWHSASRDERRRMREEELRVVIAGIRADPWGQLRASARNFGRQLDAFGLYASAYWDPYVVARIDEALPRSEERHLASRQARGTLGEEPLSRIQRSVVAGSIVVVGLLALPLARWEPRAFALAVLVIAGLLANAAITGVLSTVNDRFQCRVVWLLPLLAWITASVSAQRWRANRASRSAVRQRNSPNSLDSLTDLR